MAMITSVRAPIPVTEVPRQPRLAEVSTLANEKQGSPPPVSAPMRAEALHQAHEKPGLEAPPLHAAQISAAAAAEAAKDTYIRARIAAGLNPLPLP
jgi:hypothetical protein